MSLSWVFILLHVAELLVNDVIFFETVLAIHFQTFHDNNLHLVLHLHTGFSHFVM